MAEKEKVLFSRGPSATIPSSKVPGTIYITTDTGEMFVDDTATSRVQVGPSPADLRLFDATSATNAEITAALQENKLCYVHDTDGFWLCNSYSYNSGATNPYYSATFYHITQGIFGSIDYTSKRWTSDNGFDDKRVVEGVSTLTLKDMAMTVVDAYDEITPQSGGTVNGICVGAGSGQGGHVPPSGMTFPIIFSLGPTSHGSGSAWIRDADGVVWKGSTDYGTLRVTAVPTNRFVVRLTRDSNGSFTADKTIAEIVTAYEAGKDVVASIEQSGLEFPLRGIVPGESGASILFDLSLLADKSFQLLMIDNTGVHLSEELLIPRIEPVDKTSDMTSPVGMDLDGKLWSKADTSLGMTGATVGQIAKITTVDDSGKPTAWEAVDMPSGGKPFVVTVTYGDDNRLTADKTHEEIAEAYTAGEQINAKIVNYPGVVVPSILPLYVNTSNKFIFSGSGVLSDKAMAMTAIDNNGIWSVNLAELAQPDDFPIALPSPNALTVKVGDTTTTYDGSAAKTVEIKDAGELVTETTEVLPAYTNQIPLSVDASGAIYNGVGYKSDVLLNSSGSEVSGSGTFVSGFIPVKKGDIIRVKDTSSSAIDTSCVFTLTADKVGVANCGKTISDISKNALYGTITINGNMVTWDTSGIGYYFWNGFSWLRVTTTSANSVVTVNEEIVDTSQTVMTLNPTIKVGQENLNFSVSAPLLADRKVVVFGDSLIGMTRDQTSVPAYTAAYTGAEVYNVGFGGCRMSVHPTSGYAAFSMWALADAVTTGTYTTQDAQASSGSDYFPEQLALLKSIDFSTVDMIVIHYGTNDFAANVVIDNESDDDDTTTLCGALRYSLRKLMTAYPKIRIFVSVPIYRKWGDVGAETYVNSNGKKLWDFCTALAGVATEFNCAVIDGYRSLGINATNDAAFSSDGTHLNDHGRKAFGECIGGNLIAPIPADCDHTHSADKITAGTFGGKVVANQAAVAVLGDAQVRNIKITDTDLVAGTSELASGEVVIVYE